MSNREVEQTAVWVRDAMNLHAALRKHYGDKLPTEAQLEAFAIFAGVSVEHFQRETKASKELSGAIGLGLPKEKHLKMLERAKEIMLEQMALTVPREGQPDSSIAAAVEAHKDDSMDKLMAIANGKQELARTSIDTSASKEEQTFWENRYSGLDKRFVNRVGTPK